MISFIIIGRNEGWKLTKCLESVLNTIKYNSLSKYEVIYVDSRSADDSIARAKKYKEVKIFQLTDDYNAAIARNLGAEKSTGKVLYFIDGDMEIQCDFLNTVYSEEIGLKYDFVSGQYVNYFYNNKNKLLFKEHYDKAIEKGDQYKVVTGGIFLIERKLWNLVNGMNNKYKRSQDIDFGLRLAKKGVKLLRKKEVIAIHHTISYRDKIRMWKMLINKTELFGRSLLFRDHFFNKHVYPIFFRSNYSLIFLALTLFLIGYFLSFYAVIFYFIIILLRSFFVSRKNLIRLFEFFAYFILRDVVVFIGIFVFFPSKKFNIKYNEF